MRRFLRRPILLLAVLQLTACRYWQRGLEGPAVTLSDPETRHVRITRTDTNRFEMRVAEVQGDSIYGTMGGAGPLSCQEASALCSVRMPMSEAAFVETRSFSVIRTAAIVAVPLAVLAVVFIVEDPCSPLDEPC